MASPIEVGVSIQAAPGEETCRDCEGATLFFRGQPENAEVVGLAIHATLAWKSTSGPENPFYEKRQNTLEYARQLLHAKFGEGEGDLWIERVNLIADSYAKAGMRCEPCPLRTVMES